MTPPSDLKNYYHPSLTISGWFGQPKLLAKKEFGTHLFGQKNLGQKKFGSKKIWVQKNLGPKKIVSNKNSEFFLGNGYSIIKCTPTPPNGIFGSNKFQNH